MQPTRGLSFRLADAKQVQALEEDMAKEQKRGTREAKKPKKEKPKVIAAAAQGSGAKSTVLGKK